MHDSSPQATLDNFATHLRSRSYSSTTIQQYVAVARRFYAWYCRTTKRRHPVSEASVESFVRQHCSRKEPNRMHHIRSSMRHLVRMLRDRGELAQTTTTEITAIDLAVQEFVSHLSDVAGLAETTRRQHAYYVRRFLKMIYGNGPVRLDRLCRENLVRFVRSYAKQWAPSSVQVVASALRTFLRYLQHRGICSEQLVAAVPAGPRWKGTSLPRVMTKEQLRAFLSSFDRATAMGRRNYAIAQLMATLGLRVGEVAMLQLEHLNWRDSFLQIVSPKCRCVKVLPMPVCVGEAIAEYLREGRPTVSHRHVFTRHVTSADPLSRDAMRAMVIRAYRQCGFDPQWQGTHILRHTVATHMHQHGATLKEVADLLGHRSIETSAVYAKVNLPELASVALPWPEVTT